MAVTIGILKELETDERRVALVPDDVAKLRSRNFNVMVECGAGSRSYFGDREYAKSGADVTEDRNVLIQRSDVLFMLQRPSTEDISLMKENTVVAGSIYPLRFPDTVEKMAAGKITAYSLELMPRTSRAQSMDILSSQSSAAGYRAAITGAFHSPRFMPMLTTAAGTVRPASVLVIGAGVAGLMAIATAKRLGASVASYDVRKSAGEDVRSLGARFLELGVDAVGKGGYARELTEEERSEEKQILEDAIRSSDIIITTAGVPGKKSPLILTSEMVAGMKRGSVIVDITAESGGNCELTAPGKLVETDTATVIGLLNAPAEVPVNASQMYSKNIMNFISVLFDSSGNFAEPEKDELLSACVVCKGGKVLFRLSNGGGN